MDCLDSKEKIRGCKVALTQKTATIITRDNEKWRVADQYRFFKVGVTIQAAHM